jgi:hypothetical protein
MIYVFKCIAGLGNRLCNLMNMFYLHSVYPDAKIYIVWLINNHCGAALSDLIDLSEHKWILPESEYRLSVYPRLHRAELYSISSLHFRTRWDKISTWTKHPIIVSVSHHLYEFVPLTFCLTMFATFKFSRAVNENVLEKISKYGTGCPIIHFRQGDLLKLLGSESSDFLSEKYRTILSQYPNALTSTYNQMIPDRPASQVVDSLGDLLFFAKHCNVVAYCPYSWFSSWVFLLSPKFRIGLPIFDGDLADINMT